MILTNAKHLTLDGRGVIRLEAANGVVWKGLPAGYTRLDYIESTDGQYIDTEVIPNQDSRVVVEFAFLYGQGVYGSRDTTNIDGFCFRVNSERWQPQYNDLLKSIYTPVPDNEWHVSDQNKNVWSLDGVALHTFTYAEFSSPHPFVIGGIMANKSGVKSFYDGSNRYRACQIYDNGVLVRDFIPCKTASGEIGMYDLLNAKFYGNAGTGTFVAGEVVS